MGGSPRILHCKHSGRSCIAEISTDARGSDEHYRRSPGCAFFVFAGTSAPKTGRGKKGRPSKASRFSTQSNVTTASQAQSIPDLNDSIDTSNISQDTVLSTASTMANKKGGRGKGRSTRAKNAEPIEVVEANGEAVEDTAQEPSNVVRCGTKRKSEEISEDPRTGRESTVKPEPLPKRRATRNRNSEAPQVDHPVLDTVDSAPLKGVRGGRKRASSRTRKISPALRAAIPDDMEIEAALEADLDKDIPEQPHVESEATEELPKPRTRGRAKKTTASTAPTRNTRQATAESEASQTKAVESEELLPVSKEEEEDKVAPKGKGRKTRVTKKAVGKKAAQLGRASYESNATLADSQLNSSIITTQTMADDSGHESDASIASQKSVARKGSKRKANGKGKGKKGQTVSKNIEDILQAQPGSQAMAEAEPNKANAADQMVEDEAPKKATRATRGGKAKANATTKAKTKFPQLSMPGMFSPLMGDIDPSFNSVLATSSPPVVPAMRSDLGADQRIPISIARPSSPKVSQAPKDNTPSPPITVPSSAQRQTVTPQENKRTNEVTPSPSPQSSDAENQPPGSRPPSVRPPLAPLSPMKGVIQRIPLAPGTPRQVPLSPSKIGGLKSEMPWTAVDVEMIFAPSPEKENQNIFAGSQKGGLTSPEKTMTVEEWIQLQASGAEESLKAQAERVVGIFEREGGRALRVLEGIDVLE
jgi:hypothetical protein